MKEITTATQISNSLRGENGNKKELVGVKDSEVIVMSKKEGPSLLDEMITAQVEAKKGKIDKAREQEKDFDVGFKKGFMRSSFSKRAGTVLSSKPDINSCQTQINVSGSQNKEYCDSSNGITTIIRASNLSGLLLDEVQSVMAAEEGIFPHQFQKKGIYKLTSCQPYYYSILTHKKKYFYLLTFIRMDRKWSAIPFE